jgi:Ca2+/H+ antiporter, TMEM165/GDT1 family
MSGTLFALLATLLAGIGARDQLTVAALAARNGQHWMLLAISAACAIATAALAAFAARAVIPLLAGDARQLLAALALGLAGGEMLLLRAKPLGTEPTQSLGAAAIVLFAQQLTDAARFIIFALAVATSAPMAVGAGGAAGGVAIVAAGWLGAEELADRNLRLVRLAGGSLLLAVAAWLAYGVFGR